jgi:hypothetical protein
MLDNDLIRLFRPLLINGFLRSGFNNVTVQQSYLPNRQGVPSNPVVYFQKLYDKRYGFCSNNTEYDYDLNQMIRTEEQVYETTFQVSSLLKQDPSNIGYTSSDLINIASQTMQTETTLKALNSAGVGILRVTNVRNPFDLNDKDEFASSASFDFTLTHNQILKTVSDLITNVIIKIYRV